MPTKLLDPISWRDALREIRGEWRWDRERAIEAMVTSLQGGLVSYRGAAYRADWESRKPKRVALREVVAGMLTVQDRNFPILVKYRPAGFTWINDPRRILPVRLLRPARTVELSGAVLSRVELRNELIRRYGLPAGAQPSLNPQDAAQTRKRLGYMAALKQFLGGLHEDTDLSDLSAIAGLFITHVGTLDEAARPPLPARRYVKAQIEKLLPKLQAHPNNT
jgi:hypothetical protein